MVYPKHLRNPAARPGVVLWALSLALVIPCLAARAQESTPTDAQRNPAQVMLFHQHAEDFKGGKQLAVTVYISAFQWDGLSAMGLYETVPEGWTFAGARAIAGAMPGVVPENGDSGVLQFMWIEQSTAPVTFQYLLNIPPRDSGTRVLSGQVEYRLGEGALTSNVAFSQLTGVADALPVLTLRGNPTLRLSLDNAFNDPGATATDVEDGDLSSRVEVAGVVDTSEPGTYTLTYGVTDSVGNRAVPVTRQVTVLEAPADPGGAPTEGDKPGQSGGIGLDGGAINSRPGLMAKNAPDGSPAFPPIKIPEVHLKNKVDDVPVPLKSGEADGKIAGNETTDGKAPGTDAGDFRTARAADPQSASETSAPSGAPGLTAEPGDPTNDVDVAQTPWVLMLVALFMGAGLIAVWLQSRPSGQRRSSRKE
jgi:hypothetical protein